VEKGQLVATMADAFGRTTDMLMAPEAGTVAASFTDPRRERGGMIVRIIYTRDDPACAFGCP
jgi:predicted deacylase